MKKRHLLNFMLSALFLLMANVLMAQSITTDAFKPFVPYTTPTGIVIVNGDLDGDGKPDLLAVSGSNVSVFRNTGSGLFEEGVTIATVSGLEAVTIGDIDGDGKLDVATANGNSNTVTVFRNTNTVVGTLSFASEVTFLIDARSSGLTIGDIDGDGKSDLVMAINANNPDAKVIVLRNTGSIGTIAFADYVSFATGNKSRNVVIGDIDGDGKPDLALGNSNGPFGGNTVSVLRNTGSSGTIAFAASVELSTGEPSDPWNVAIGDLDGDGKLDLAAAATTDARISVFRNKSSIGTIEFEARADYQVSATPRAVLIRDINGDGIPDLVSANYNTTTEHINVLINKGLFAGGLFVDGSFEPYLGFSTGSGSTYLTIGDFDGDGKPDVAANVGTAGLAVLLNNLTWTGSPSIDWTSDLNAYAIRNGEIRVNGEVSKNAVATLYDIQGRVVLVKNMEEGSLNVIPTPYLKTGIYLLFVKNNEKVQRIKIPVNE